MITIPLDPRAPGWHYEGMEKTKRIRITTEAEALAYLTGVDYYRLPSMKQDEKGAHWIERVTCSRCGGRGYYPSQFHGACFECNGNPPNYLKRIDVITEAKLARRRELADARANKKRAAKTAARDERVNAEATAFDAEFPGVRDALAPYLPFYREDLEVNRAEKDHRILNDMAGKLARYGSLSAKAVAFAEKMLADEAAPKVELEEGRREITGKVLKAAWYGSDYGETLKFTLDLENGTRVFGSVPAALQYSELGRRLRKGDRVTLTATITRSDDSVDFGFYKRPSKASLVEGAPEDAPEACQD